ncbi:MAG: glutamate synthase subunit beta [Coriobacteriales bacterium]|nr:glutamate synthase subunit beta [Coriobacteriales bacterium]
MGVPGAYLKIARCEHNTKPAGEAVRNFDSIVEPLSEEKQREQASRCMNCGVPFCQSGLVFNNAQRATGCPLHNLIPEINDLLCHNRMEEAAERLALTNPFPEFTGRVCPAPCETACNLGLHEEAVTIHDNELAVSEYYWAHGMEPLLFTWTSAPLVSVIGSGPAGLAAGWELARNGFRVRIYEQDDRPGGLLMYGIPAMKLPKDIVMRRIELMRQSGIEFLCNKDAVQDAQAILRESFAVVLAIGARVPRSVRVPGANLPGIHFAVNYLTEATKSLLDGREPTITAKGKDVLVIGGGDTGTDCVATALRQGAQSVHQIIRASCPPAMCDSTKVWPGPRNVYSQSYGHVESAEVFGEDPRMWSCDTVAFKGSGAVEAATIQDNMSEDSSRDIPAQLVLIAKGFTGPEQRVLDAFAGSDKVFLAGDALLGPSLVAQAMAHGLETAAKIAAQ